MGRLRGYGSNKGKGPKSQTFRQTSFVHAPNATAFCKKSSKFTAKRAEAYHSCVGAMTVMNFFPADVRYKRRERGESTFLVEKHILHQNLRMNDIVTLKGCRKVVYNGCE